MGMDWSAFGQSLVTVPPDSRISEDTPGAASPIRDAGAFRLGLPGRLCGRTPLAHQVGSWTQDLLTWCGRK